MFSSISLKRKFFNDPKAEDKGQGHRSRSNVQKLAKIYKMGHFSDTISPTDFILGKDDP